jgi:hypothetical protein
MKVRVEVQSFNKSEGKKEASSIKVEGAEAQSPKVRYVRGGLAYKNVNGVSGCV